MYSFTQIFIAVALWQSILRPAWIGSFKSLFFHPGQIAQEIDRSVLRRKPLILKSKKAKGETKRPVCQGEKFGGVFGWAVNQKMFVRLIWILVCSGRSCPVWRPSWCDGFASGIWKLFSLAREAPCIINTFHWCIIKMYSADGSDDFVMKIDAASLWTQQASVEKVLFKPRSVASTPSFIVCLIWNKK